MDTSMLRYEHPLSSVKFSRDELEEIIERPNNFFTTEQASEPNQYLIADVYKKPQSNETNLIKMIRERMLKEQEQKEKEIKRKQQIEDQIERIRREQLKISEKMNNKRFCLDVDGNLLNCRSSDDLNVDILNVKFKINDMRVKKQKEKEKDKRDPVKKGTLIMRRPEKIKDEKVKKKKNLEDEAFKPMGNNFQ